MIEMIASTVVSESVNNPGWFLVHAIGLGMGILGLVFFLGTAVGMVRFPDFYTRMHAAGKGDTLSTMLSSLCPHRQASLQGKVSF